MFKYFSELVTGKCGLDPDRIVIIGVSGGPDSLCLLDVLDRLGYSLVVAHLNHQLRLEAGKDAQVVKMNAEERGLSYVYAETNVVGFAETGGYSLEEAGRILRYRFLFEQARQFSAQAVAVGHTANDQVETVLMHILRGTGLEGLKGMEYRSLPNPWSEVIPLVRPLLSTWREQVLDYCQEFNLGPVMDQTNQNTTYYRNRLRHELLPYLESYQSNVRQSLWRMAQVLAGDNAILEGVVKTSWDKCVKQKGLGYVVFELELFLNHPQGVQRHLLRHALTVLHPGLRDISYASIERALNGLTQPEHKGQTEITAGIRLGREGKIFWLATREADLPRADWPQMPVGDQLLMINYLDLPGIVDLMNGWQIRAELVDAKIAQKQAVANTDPYQAWIALDGVKTPLIVRTRQPGERFQPFGMGGHTLRLSEFMINVKVPCRARAGWPLICAQVHNSLPINLEDTSQREQVPEEHIVWLPGYRLGDAYRLTEMTQQAAWLRILNKDET